MFQIQNHSQMLYFDIAPVPMLIVNELGEIVHSNRECQSTLRLEQGSHNLDGCFSAGVWYDIKRYFASSASLSHFEPFHKVATLSQSNKPCLLKVSVDTSASSNIYIVVISDCATPEKGADELDIDGLPYGMAVVDAEGQFVNINKAFYMLLGYSEYELKGISDFELTYEPDANSEKPLRRQLVTECREHYQVDKRYVHKNGHHIWVRSLVSAVSSDKMRADKFVVSVFDIHEEKQLQDVISTSERRFRIIAENVSSVVWISAPDPMRLYYANRCFNDIWEEPVESLYGDPRVFLNRVHPSDREMAATTRFSSSSDSWSVNYRLLFPDGRIKHVRDSGHCVFDGSNELIYRVGTMTDITSEIDQRDTVVTMAHHLRKLVEYDSLTGIKSRHAIMNDIRETYQQHALTGAPSILVYIDADGFKGINDTYGHKIGDEVLVKIAEHLTRNIRDSDVAGRIGGDEFVVLLRHTAQSEVPQIMERLCQDIRSEGLPNGITVSLTLGEKELTSDIQSAEQWLSVADKAMYQNKRRKKASYTRTSTPM
ncbi:diguanylate cyclase [Enterovibrio makurazakiensis]|uniref:sensor domain-containing diguanylate cyclase n=1 Tax=Enterovibrio makurazakiensis TaxID=2910232 RepID=UPI003D1CA221